MLKYNTGNMTVIEKCLLRQPRLRRPNYKPSSGIK